MSARRRAGASLTPSPVIATTWPSARSASAIRSFASGCCGRRSARSSPAQQLVELGSLIRVELVARSRPRIAAADADPPGDRRRGEAVIAGDDDDPDAGRVAARDRVGHLRPRRVDHRDQAEQDEVALGVLAPRRDGSSPSRRRRRRPAPAGPARRSSSTSPRPRLRSRRRGRARPVGVRRCTCSAGAPPPARPWCGPTARRRARSTVDISFSTGSKWNCRSRAPSRSAPS